ncbi:MAG TPA: hypothetical protein PK297_06285 [Spirochaetota bacterium]|nr:hypothetical protein [Spirochaetota bacterium]
MKKYVVLASLVLAFSLVACGGSAESKAAKEIAPIVTAYGETAKGIVAKYQAAKTAEEVKTVNTDARKAKREFFKTTRAILSKYKGDIDEKKFGEEGNELGKLLADAKKFDDDIRAAGKAAETVTKKTNEKKK